MAIFSTMMPAKTGGVVLGRLPICLLVNQVAPIAKYFMNLILSSMTQNGVNNVILTVTAVDLWKLATLYLWNISVRKMGLRNYQNKMLILAAA